MAERVFLAWLGNADRDAASGKLETAGPIAPVLDQRQFDRVVLVDNSPPARSTPYLAWLKKRGVKADLELRSVELKSPTDHRGIVLAVRPILEELKAAGANVTVHLSPGTPAMHAVWVLLCKTQYPAELIQTSKEAGIEAASIPFDIFADFVPELLRAPADALVREDLDRPPLGAAFTDILHRSKEMREVIEMAQRVALWPVPVLLDGESGTGKELFARAIHNASPRAERAFIALNCGAIPKDMVEAELFGYRKGAFTGADSAHDGAFVQADGGTLFLDELGELPLDAQVKLLRALDQREIRPLGRPVRTVDVRVIAATNRSLPEEIAAGRFREDLYYRVATAVLHLPPLRARRGDMALLLDHALDRANETGKEVPGFQSKKLSPSARSLLSAHPWPGNVRELMSTVRRVAIWTEGSTIGPEDARRALLGGAVTQADSILHRSLDSGVDLQDILGEVARHYILRALESTGHVKKEAAKLLGFASATTLTNWMTKQGIKGE